MWPPAEAGRASDDPLDDPPDGGRTERRAMVAELLAGFRERHPDVLVVTHLVRGEPVAGLVGWSWRADLRGPAARTAASTGEHPEGVLARA